MSWTHALPGNLPDPQIVFADTPLDRAIDTVLTSVFLHSGQVCTSATRLIVEDSIADALVSGVVQRASLIRLGNGMDATTETGPLVSAAHLAKMDAYISMGIKDGAVLRCGGTVPDRKDAKYSHLHSDGFFFLPTVFDRCHRDMQIVQAETFGPILTVERFANGDEERAVSLGISRIKHNSSPLPPLALANQRLSRRASFWLVNFHTRLRFRPDLPGKRHQVRTGRRRTVRRRCQGF